MSKEELSKAVEPSPAVSIQPQIGMIDGSIPPDSERTVYKRVPQDLLQRARKAAVSEAPPPAPLASFDDADDRTAIFAPPRELLLGGKSEPAPPIPQASALDEGAEPMAHRDTPVISEQASLLLAQLQSRPAPPPTLAPEASLDAPISANELDTTDDSESQEDVEADEHDHPAHVAARRRRTIALVAFFVFLFLAAGLAYVQHSGASFLTPS